MGSISGPTHGSVTTPERENSVSSLRLGSVSLLDHYAINNRQGGPNDGGITLPAIGDADGNRLVIDHENIWRSCKAEEMRSYGSRRVENLAQFSEDLEQSVWTTANNAVVDSATQVTFDGTASGQLRHYNVGSGVTVVSGETVIVSAYIRLVSGTISADNNVALGVPGSAGMRSATTVSADIGSDLTSTLQRFSVPVTADANGDIDVTLWCNVAATLEVTKFQVEISTGRADTTTPSEYVSTGVGTGPELWTDSPDTVDAGWTDNGDGTYTCDGTNGANVIINDTTIKERGTYILEFTVDTYNSGTVALYAHATSLRTASTGRTAAGTYREVLQVGTAAGASDRLRLSSDSSFNGTVSNISVKRIDHGANVDGVQYFDTENGNSVASNVVTEGAGAALSTVKGYMPEGEAINLLASSTARDFTNAAWTKTNITPVKNATGITGDANSASTLTADAGNGTVFQAVTDASALHYATFWVKRKTGTGTIEITVDGGSTYADITSSINSSTFTHVLTSKTAANPSIGFRIVTSGDEIEVDYAGCWDTPYSYSPVEGGVTRLADREATIPGAYFPDGIGSIEFELTPLFNTGPAADVGIISTNGTADNLLSFTTTPLQIEMNDGTTAGQLSSAWTNPGDTITVKARWNSNSNMDFSVDGTAEGGITFDGSFNPSGDMVIGKGLTQGFAIKNIKIYHQDNGDNWLV